MDILITFLVGVFLPAWFYSAPLEKEKEGIKTAAAKLDKCWAERALIQADYHKIMCKKGE